jgi:hypothetical protein
MLNHFPLNQFINDIRGGASLGDHDLTDGTSLAAVAASAFSLSTAPARGNGSVLTTLRDS